MSSTGTPRDLDTTTAIEVAELTTRYDRHALPVLTSLSASIRAARVTALLGPNGVGKTTLLDSILGWLPAESGTISLFGRAIDSLSRREMGQTLALLPQEEHIPFEYRVIDYVLLGRTPYLSPLAAPGADDRALAHRAIERVGIEKIVNAPVTEISGGERQLVMLARSLAQQPRVLLLDEPTSHLDIRNKRRLADLLRSLAADGTTVLFTTHDPEFAAVVADDLLLLHEGRALAGGPVNEVMREETLSRVFGIPISLTWTDGHPTVRW